MTLAIERLRGVRSVAVGLLLLIGAAQAHAEVVFARERLSARFERAPARQALREIEKAAPVRVRAPESVLDRTVSVSVEDLPLDEAMKRILRALGVENHATLVDPADDRRVYLVLDGGGAPEGTGPAAPPSAAAEGPLEEDSGNPVVATPEGLSKWKERHEAWRAQRGGSLEWDPTPNDRKRGRRRDAAGWSAERDRPRGPASETGGSAD